MQREQTQENTKARERQGKGKDKGKGIQSTRTKRLTHSHAATKKDEKGTTHQTGKKPHHESQCECECRPNIQTTQKRKKEKKFGRTKQIVEDRAEPQQIVATRPLYCLQHPLPIQVVCKRFFPAHIDIAIHEVDSRPFRPLPVPRQLWYTSIRDALFLLISYKRDQHHRFQHRFWLRGVQPLSSVW